MRWYGRRPQDLKPDPIASSRASLWELRPQVPALLHRVAELEPERILLIKTDVYGAAYSALADAGLPVSTVRIPFPSSGRQTESPLGSAGRTQESNQRLRGRHRES
jgi:hypothetical protein